VIGGGGGVVLSSSAVFSRGGGGKILTDFLGGGRAKYEKTQKLCVKAQKSLFFKIRRGGGKCPPPQ